MRLIAIEEHLLPQDIVERIADDSRINSSVDMIAKLAKYSGALGDAGDGRLEDMDKVGIDVQVLSFVGGDVVQALEPKRSISLSEEINDRMAEAVAKNPSRFAAFANLPLSDPERAAIELHRCVKELGFVGAMVHGQTRGIFLDQKEMSPVLAAANDLGVPIYLHPGPPPKSVYDGYYSDIEPSIAGQLSTGAWGWHSECGMHVLRMSVTGTFERFPNLQIILGHMGEMLPFSLQRADDRLMMLPALKDRPVSVMQEILEHVHITTAGYVSNPPLLCALMVFGAERILFAVDYPFAGPDCKEATAFLREAPISPTDREKIAHENAESLLGLATTG